MYLLKSNFFEVIFFLLLLWLGFHAIRLIFQFLKNFINSIFKSGEATRPTTSPSQTTRQSSRESRPQRTASKPDPTVYRPSSSSKPNILFKDNSRDTLKEQDIKDLVDALTGAQLDPSQGLYQCNRCKVFYQAHSYEVIRSENGGRCVSCLNATIESVTGRREQRGRNADVSVITLTNYQQHVGRVITFEGFVHNVLTSRRGSDYAVMFENKSWTKGFKMVVFRGDVYKIGGHTFLSSLIGRTIRIRGLLVKHERFGYEIIISEREMILSSR